MRNRVAEYLDAEPEELLDRYVGDERSHSWRAGFVTGLIIGVVAAALVASFFWPRAAGAMPQWLVFTVPDRGQNCYQILGEDGDSVRVCECTGTAPISQVAKVRLYGARLTGGGFMPVDSLMWLPEEPIEGRQDSIRVPFPGNFYVKFENPAGWSCESPIATVLPDVTTGVETGPVDQTPFPPVRPTWHDVSGRRVEGPRGTGIFFQRVKMPDQKVYARRVFVRASRPYSFGRWRSQ